MKLRLTIDGKIYEVEVEVMEDGPQPSRSTSAAHTAAPVAAPAATAPSAPPTAASGGDPSKQLVSPISGVVMRIPVQVGQSVKTNDELLVLEAMKMETVITSQCDGKIVRICANEGDAVQVQQVLVEFE